MMKARWVLLIVSLLSLSVANCGGSTQIGDGLTQSTATLQFSINPNQESTIQPESPVESEEMSVPPIPVEKFVALSKKDLAVRLQVDLEKITVTKTVDITWPDASLGCPSPGKVYAQGKVLGYRIWLEVAGKEYVYHTDLNGSIILCTDQGPVDSSNSGPTPNIGVPID